MTVQVKIAQKLQIRAKRVDWSPIWIFSSDCDRPSSLYMASAPSGLMWLTIRLAHKGQWEISQLNKLLGLQSLEECWLTRTQLKRIDLLSWNARLGLISASLLCIITISKTRVSSHKWNPCGHQGAKDALVTEGSSALDAHKENHMKEVLSCTRSWIRIWNSAGKDDLNKK